MNFFHKISTLLNGWLLFIRQHYSSVFFIAFFYSLLLCSHYIQNADLSLHTFPGRMLGQATASGVDIGKRVSVFYNSLFILVAINALFYLVAFLVHRKFPALLKEIHIINIISIAGCTLVFLQAFNYNVRNCINIILLLQGIAIAFIVIKNVLLKPRLKKVFNGTTFSIGLCTAFSFYFLTKECSYVFNITWGPDSMLAILSIFCLFCFLLLALLFKNSDYSCALNALTKTTWVLVPLMLLPLFTVIKDEMYLILNHKGIHSFTPMKIYLCLVLLTAIWVYIRSRKPIEKLESLRPFSLLANYYFPLFVLGITTYFYYSPFYINTSSEMFEQANRFLPVSEFYTYHVLPLADKFNSHLLNDFSTFFLYSCLNGLRGMEPLIYEFIFRVTTALILYYVIKDFTRNPYVALFIVLLFPYASQLIPDYYAPALIAVYVLHKIIYSAPSVKNYLLLPGIILLLMFWRIDLGVAGLFAIVFILLVYALAGKFKLKPKPLLISAVWIFSVVLIILLCLWIRGLNIKTNFLYVYNYLASSQAFGFSRLSDSYTIKEFQVQYYVFPVVCLLLVGYLLIHFKTFLAQKRFQFAVICLLFTISFYFINFQRGLVRHSFLEQVDMMLSSFAFFIIPGSVYFFYKQKSHIIKFLLFFFGGFLLITAFHYPESHSPIPLESFYSKLNNITHIEPKNDIKRELNPEFLEKDYKEFQSFVAEELKKDETFVDFAETPMFYYFTNKETPSFFYQGIENITNEYLQNQFLKDLTKYKTPLLVFSKFPNSAEEWAYSNPYKIAEYLFQHYKPFAIVQNYCLWESNDADLKNDTTHFFSTLGKKYNDSPGVMDSITTKDEGNILIRVSEKKNNKPGCFIWYSKNEDNLNHKPEVCFADTASGRTYYAIKHEKNQLFRLFTNNFDSTATIEITDTKYLPDFYSACPRTSDLYMIPYIWANYDDRINSAVVQNTISTADAEINKSAVTYELPQHIDKSTGNYILLSVDANNSQPVNIQLTYGTGNGKINFELPPGNGIRRLAVRISCQYNWFAKESSTISFYAPADESIHLKKVVLLKGD